MRFSVFALLALLVTCCTASGIQAEQNGVNMPLAGRMLELFTETYDRMAPPGVEEVRVSDFSCQPEALVVPDGELSFAIIGPVNGGTPGKKFLTVALLADGREVGSARLNGECRFWGHVLVAERNLARRTILGAHDMRREFRDISMLGGDLVRDPAQAVGKKLVKTIRSGTLLHANFLRAPKVVRRGDRVTIMVNNGSLRVSAPGEAKTGGAVGEVVRVKNLMSRRVVQARVKEAGVVEVEML